MIYQANPKAAYEADAAAFLEAARRVLESGCYILSEEVSAFERNFAKWCGAGQAVGCASGTDAIELILRALDVKPKCVVFTVAHTAVATVAAIERAGAVPWMVDVENPRLTMDAEALAEAVSQCQSSRPDLSPWAVLPVHIYGQPADMDSLGVVAKKNRLWLLEDCAQSHGACYGETMTGRFGFAAAFSFYPTKNLGAFGDAGLVLTDDDSLAEKLTHLRQYGWKERYISLVSGLNSRLDPLQAAFLNIKLKSLEADNGTRRRLAALYDSLLAPLEEAGKLTIVKPAPNVSHVYHQYVIRTKRRDELKDFCLSRNIGTAVHYPVPIHLQPAFIDRTAYPLAAKGLPETEAAAREILSLPMYPQLSDEEVRTVAETILSWGNLS
jgi:dTDP-4-amino-4,6-dideoxygalactose transaminase